MFSLRFPCRPTCFSFKSAKSQFVLFLHNTWRRSRRLYHINCPQRWAHRHRCCISFSIITPALATASQSPEHPRSLLSRAMSVSSSSTTQTSFSCSLSWTIILTPTPTLAPAPNHHLLPVFLIMLPVPTHTHTRTLSRGPQTTVLQDPSLLGISDISQLSVHCPKLAVLVVGRWLSY